MKIVLDTIPTNFEISYSILLHGKPFLNPSRIPIKAVKVRASCTGPSAESFLNKKRSKD